MSQKISDMTSASDLSGAVVPIVQGGANKKASIELFNPLAFFRGSTNDRYLPLLPLFSTTTLVLTINVLRAHSVLIQRSTTIDKIGLEVTAGAGGSIYLGIYNSDSTGKPDSLVYSTAALSTATPGAKIETIATPLVLEPGLYWFAYNTDTANTSRALSFSPVPGTIGYGPTLGAGVLPTIVTVAHAFGALPSSFGAFTFSNINNPLIVCRIA